MTKQDMKNAVFFEGVFCFVIALMGYFKNDVNGLIAGYALATFGFFLLKAYAVFKPVKRGRKPKDIEEGQTIW